MTEAPQSPNEPKLLGTFVSLIGLLSIALFFTGWVYRYAYFGFFRLNITALDLPAQSFFFVPIQAFLGGIPAFFTAILALILTVLLIRVTLWVTFPPDIEVTNSSGVGESRPNRLIQKLHRGWVVRQLKVASQGFPPTLLRDLIIVAWTLTMLYWVAQWQGITDARHAAVDETSRLPVITLVSSVEKDLGIGRKLEKLEDEHLEMQEDPLFALLEKGKIIGDTHLLRSLSDNDPTGLPIDRSWRLLLNRGGWLYIFQTIPADTKGSPVTVAIREGGGDQWIVLSPSASKPDER